MFDTISRLRRWGACAVVALACATGCGQGDGLDRVAVSGKVTLHGTPLENGVIRFQPAVGNSGPTVTALVQNGGYDIPLGLGPIPGAYELHVSLPPNAKTDQLSGAAANVPGEQREWTSSMELPAGSAKFEHHVKLP